MDLEQEKTAGTTISTFNICPGGAGRLYAFPRFRCAIRNTSSNKHLQVFWLLGPYAVFTLAFGGIIVPKLNL